MKKLPKITSALPVILGVLKLNFDDGYEGVVDLRPLLAKGGVFEWLRQPEHFSKLKVEDFGHSIYWTDETGYEIDLGADALRRDCERQAEMHNLMTA